MWVEMITSIDIGIINNNQDTHQKLVPEHALSEEQRQRKHSRPPIMIWMITICIIYSECVQWYVIMKCMKQYAWWDMHDKDVRDNDVCVMICDNEMQQTTYILPYAQGELFPCHCTLITRQVCVGNHVVGVRSHWCTWVRTKSSRLMSPRSMSISIATSEPQAWNQRGPVCIPCARSCTCTRFISTQIYAEW